MREILAAKPSITELEIGYVADAVTNGWGKNCYDYIFKFKEIVSQYFSSRYVWPTSSCHGALHIILKAIGVSNGDEVIVPDITWASGSVFPICWQGAKPIFVDVLEDNWCIDPDKVEEKITSRTKAIIAVHLYGNLAKLRELKDIAERYDLILIEDAAEALGSEYYGEKAGSIGDFGIFSFHGTKTLTTGEGGVIISNRDDFSLDISTIENQGRRPGSKFFWCDEIGLKYKMSNIQAALGLAQFERVDELVDKKRQIFTWYKAEIEDWPDITTNEEYEGTLNSYWQPTIVFGSNWKLSEDKRSKLIDEMINRKINIRPFFYPTSLMPPFTPESSNVVSYDLYYRGINLPSYHEMGKEDVEYVIGNLESALKHINLSLWE